MKKQRYVINRDRLLKTFIDLVKIPSPSWKEKRVIDYITGTLKKLKVPCRLHRCGESHNLYARLEGTVTARPVLFSCHMDTVVPCDKISPVITARRISSDGTSVLGADDKAAIAAFIEAIRCLKEQRIVHRPIEFLFSCAEETGLLGIKGFDLSLLEAEYAFVFDSGGDIGRIVLEAPTQISMELNIKGKAAHAGMSPEKGISAIRVLAEILSEIPHGRIDKKTTANIGLIAGGKATNIVAEDAWCKLEVRSRNRQTLDRIEKKIKKTTSDIAARHGARSRAERNLEYTGFTISPESRIARIAASAVDKIGLTCHFESSGGGSDTNILNRAEMPAVNISIGMRNVHSTGEYILTKDLVNGARLVLALIDSV